LSWGVTNQGQDPLIPRSRFEAILLRARRKGEGICRYFKTFRRRHGQNRSNPAGTSKWLRSRARAALRVAMLPAASARTRYLRHFDASNVELMGPDPKHSSPPNHPPYFGGTGAGGAQRVVSPALHAAT